MYVSLLTAMSLYRLFYLFFSQCTSTLDYSGSSCTLYVFSLFCIVSVSLTCFSAYIRLTSLITLCIADVRVVIKGDGGESFVSRRYALNTSSVSTILSSPAELFIALTTICSSTSLLVVGSSLVSISYALRSRP